GEARLRPHETYLRRLAGVAAIEYPSGAERPKGAAPIVLDGIELAIPLRGLVDDPAGEIARNGKLLDKLDKEIGGIEAKLGNPQFLERAPADVVEKERGKQQELRDRRATIERNLERLKQL